MPVELTNTALPYLSTGSPLPQDGTFSFTKGTTDIISAWPDLAKRRPGFASPLEAIASTFTGTIVRQFSWQRWGGSYIWMANEVVGSQSKVWKYAFGIDASAQLIHTSSSTNPFYFVVSNNHVYFGNGVDMKKYDGSTVTNWGITGPSAAPTLSLSGTGITAVTGWYYVYCYYNSTTGHISSPSPVSLISGAVTNQTVNVNVTASTDTQVTGIKIFRSTDGGGGIYFEITNSPFANTTGNKADTTADTALSSTSIAPVSRRNDRPPAANGFVYYAGRLWMFADNKVWYSGFEEISSGVVEECIPSGSNGNFFPFDNQITGLSAVDDGVLVFTASTLFKIEGESQNTFRRYTLSQKRGTRSQACIAKAGRLTVWLDTSGQMWAGDGIKFEEIGMPVREDLRTVNQSTATMCFHENATQRWLLLADPANTRILVFNVDLEQWMPPWTVAANSIWSGETGAGTFALTAGTNKLYKTVDNIFNDIGSAFSSTAVFSLFPLSNPVAGSIDEFVYEYSGALPTVFRQYDEDPALATVYATMAPVDPLYITPGTHLKTSRFVDRGLLGTAGSSSGKGRRVGLKMAWPADGLDFEILSLKLAEMK